MFEPQDAANSDYLRVAEAAAAMNVPRMTVYDLVKEGKLPAVSFGKLYRIPARAVQEYLAAAQHTSAPAHLHAPT